MDPIEPQRPTNTTVVTRRDEGSVGPVIATIIILAVIVLGGLYFWSARHNDGAANQADVNGVYDEDGNMTDMNDDTSSIETDLNNTNVDDPNFDIQAS